LRGEPSGGRGRRRRRDEETKPVDYYETRDKYEDSKNNDKVDAMFGYGNGGETDRWEKTLSNEEINEIKSYSGEVYENINEALREEKFDSEYYEKGMIIQGAIEKFNLKQDIIVHRGDAGGFIPTTYGMTREKILQTFKKGDTFVQPTLISTSPNRPFENRMFAYNIKVPKGKRGAYIRGISHFGSGENEFLIKAGTKYRITKIEPLKEKVYGKYKESDWRLLVELEVID